MQLFGGKFNYSEEAMFNEFDEEKPRSNFDDFINSAMTVFQVSIWFKIYTLIIWEKNYKLLP